MIDMISSSLLLLLFVACFPSLIFGELVENYFEEILMMIAIIILLNIKKKDLKLFKYTILTSLSLIISYFLEKTITRSEGIFPTINIDIHLVLYILFCIITDFFLIMFIINCFKKNKKAEKPNLTIDEKKELKPEKAKTVLKEETAEMIREEQKYKNKK